MPKKTSVEKLDKSIRIWTHVKAGKDEYLVTSDKLRNEYVLYKILFDQDRNVTGYEAAGSDTDPLDLENKYIWKKNKGEEK